MYLLYIYLYKIQDEGFKKFVHHLKPDFKMPSNDTITNDILKRYEDKRAEMYERLTKIPGKVSVLFIFLDHI